MNQFKTSIKEIQMQKMNEKLYLVSKLVKFFYKEYRFCACNEFRSNFIENDEEDIRKIQFIKCIDVPITEQLDQFVRLSNKLEDQMNVKVDIKRKDDKIVGKAYIPFNDSGDTLKIRFGLKTDKENYILWNDEVGLSTLTEERINQLQDKFSKSTSCRL